MSAELVAAAERLRAMHRPGTPVVLPNVWDAATAHAVQEAGFHAVATSSVAVAESLGYRDGGSAPPEQMFAAAARITRAVTVPVTVDAENGYGLPAGELVERLLTAGAVGCNIEDTDHRTGALTDIGAQAERLAAIRRAAVNAGVPLVLNARIDTRLRRAERGGGDPVEQTVARATRYLDAGADCVYPIFGRDDATVAVLADRIPGALNVLWIPDGPSLSRLAELGVARVSTGGGLWQSTMRAHREALRQLSPEL